MPKPRVAIVGTGNIGTDLCFRILKDNYFEVAAFVGRRVDSPGLQLFKGEVKHLITDGIQGLTSVIDQFDGFFDATSAFDHSTHWEYLQKKNKWAIDLTPSKIGVPFVPALSNNIPTMAVSTERVANYSMVTCGGQSSAPLVYAMSQYSKGISQVEVSSSIASLSAGPATRRNVDQYIQSTENLISIISGTGNVKAILVLNPAEPPVMMRTTVQMRTNFSDLDAINNEAIQTIARISKYVPGYELSVNPHYSGEGVISATVKVTGAGYYLPPYSGNLDIINAAAVQTAMLHHEKHG